MRKYALSLSDEIQQLKKYDLPHETMSRLSTKNNALGKELAVNMDEVNKIQQATQHSEQQLNEYKANVLSLMKDVNSHGTNFADLKKAFKKLKSLPAGRVSNSSTRASDSSDDDYNRKDDAGYQSCPPVLLTKTTHPTMKSTLVQDDDDSSMHDEPESDDTDISDAKIGKRKSSTKRQRSTTPVKSTVVKLSKPVATSAKPLTLQSKLQSELKLLQKEKKQLLQKKSKLK